MSDYDVVVIGAGNAGLTAAATLQRGGARTLLVERHNVPGGCATSFVRGRFEFEVALHQLSGIGRNGEPYSLYTTLERLGVADQLEFVEEYELYRTVVPGCLDVTLPANWDEAAEAIEAAFPGNLERAQRFFALCREVTMWQAAARRGTGNASVEEQVRGHGAALLRQGLRSVKDVLDDHFDDQRVKYVLGSYWGYLGLPPSRLPFMDLAIVIFGYLELKPTHIRGGSQAMSSAILNAFISAGGTAHFSTAVTRILTRDGAVCGVRLDNGEEVTADEVVSNVSPLVTYGQMLDADVVPAAVRTDLRSRRVGISGFVLHMGLDAPPAELGFTAATNMVGTRLDEDYLAEGAKDRAPARSIVATCYDVEPIGFAPPGASHVSVLTVQYASAWDDVAPRDYARTKFAYAETLLDLAETISPDIRDAIEEVDIGTPLTMMHYLGHPGGAIYGFDQDATETWAFRNDEAEEHVPGLRHVGSWTGMGGFQPTLQAGARVARRMLRAAA